MADSPVHHRYDAVTVAFHWLTALLVFALFGTAMAWTYLPRDLGLRWLSGIHVSLGIALAGIVMSRLGWRLTAGRRIDHRADNPLAGLAARVVHLALYGLLIVQVALGFGLEWLGGGALSFFGLFDIPSPFAASRELGEQLEGLHGVIAWTMMALVGGHALAALWHHYIVRDGVLQRMVPSGQGRKRASPAEAA